MAEPTLMLFDTASVYFRAFFALPRSMRASDGTPVNAVRGFLDTAARFIKEYSPNQIACCWDFAWRPQWRVALIPTYKAHRVGVDDAEQVPVELAAQIPLVREALSLLGIPVVGAADYEADDVIATLANRSPIGAAVVTGDRDLFQVVDDERRIEVCYLRTGPGGYDHVNESDVLRRYGVRASQYADFAVLRGDPSDGLPGVPGIGAKTAAALLTSYGDLSGVLAASQAGELAPRVSKALEQSLNYLTAAGPVVAVERNAPVPEVSLAPPPSFDGERFTQFGRRWNLGGATARFAEVWQSAITQARST